MTETAISELREISVGRYDDLKAQERIVLDIEGVEIGIYFFAGEVRAWQNICPHQGGPLCQGKILPRTVQHVASDQRSAGLGFSETEHHIVCPWHGFEYDILTGRHPAKASLQLRAFAVRIADGEVLVSIPLR